MVVDSSAYRNDPAVLKALEMCRAFQERLLRERPELNKPVSPQAKPQIQPSSQSNLLIFSRLYVGSIPADLNEHDIRQLFSLYGPVKSVQLVADPSQSLKTPQQHKGFGFVDFEYPESAELALGADGTEVAPQRTLRVNRPANTPSELPAGVPRASSNRIFLAGVADSVAESDMHSVLSALGPVKTVRLLPDKAESERLMQPVHKNCGFAEFELQADAQSCISALSGFELAGRRLFCGRAVLGSPIPEGMDSVKVQPCNNNSSVILVCNLAIPEQVQTEADRADLLADCLSECRQFGEILAEQLVTDDPVRLFLQYDSIEAATAACSALNKRWFGGRQLTVVPFDQDRFLMRDLRF